MTLQGRDRKREERTRLVLVVREGSKDRIQGGKGIKFLTRWHLTGFGQPSYNFYNYGERGSSLCCCVHEPIQNSLSKNGQTAPLLSMKHLVTVTVRNISSM